MCYLCNNSWYTIDHDNPPLILELADNDKCMNASYLVKNTDVGRLERGMLSIKKTAYVAKLIDGKERQLEKLEYRFKADPSVEGKPHWGYIIYDNVGKDSKIYELWCDCQDFAYRLHYPLKTKGIARFDLEKKYSQREVKRGFGKHNEKKSKDGVSPPKANPTNKAFLCKHLIHAVWSLILGKTKSEVERPKPEAEVITAKPVKKEVIPPKGKESPAKEAPPEKKIEPEKPIPKEVSKKETPAQAEKRNAEEEKELERIEKEKEAKEAPKPKGKVEKEKSKEDKEIGKAERASNKADKSLEKREQALKKAKEVKPVAPPPAPVKPVPAPPKKEVKPNVAPPAPVKPVPKPAPAKPAPAPVTPKPAPVPVKAVKPVVAPKATTPKQVPNKLSDAVAKQAKEKADAEAKKKADAEAQKAKSISGKAEELKKEVKPTTVKPKETLSQFVDKNKKPLDTEKKK